MKARMTSRVTVMPRLESGDDTPLKGRRNGHAGQRGGEVPRQQRHVQRHDRRRRRLHLRPIAHCHGRHVRSGPVTTSTPPSPAVNDLRSQSAGSRPPWYRTAEQHML